MVVIAAGKGLEALFGSREGGQEEKEMESVELIWS
jgi:hypothetical protein